ncbi:MAG: cupin domain-containing protein [Myxococcota bacterium]
MCAYDSTRVRTFKLEDDGRIPNNPTFPVLLYPGAIALGGDPAERCRTQVEANGWGGTWLDGVFGYHHYHSNSHEFLGIVGGSATLALGGPNGVQVEVRAGDAVVLPAGTGHKRLTASSDFRVIGAYPGGMSYDMNTGEPGERPHVLANIRRVDMPEADPLFGPDGPLRALWSAST